MNPQLLRRSVKRELNKLAASCFQAIGDNVVKLLPADGCPSALSIFPEVILPFACNHETNQDVYADLLLVLKYNFRSAPQHVCGRDCVAAGSVFAALQQQVGSCSGEESEEVHRSFGGVLTCVILTELRRYGPNLSDASTLVGSLFDEEDPATCVRQRRARLVGLLTFVARLYIRAVLKLSDLAQIVGSFVGDAAVSSEEEDEDAAHRARRRKVPADAVTLDDTHLEGLLKAFVIMGNQLEQSVLGREWVSSLIQNVPAHFATALTTARSRKWVTAAPAGVASRLLTALQSQQIVDNDPSCRHRAYMGSNVDYPYYIMRQELLWRSRGEGPPAADALSSCAPLETEPTVEPVVSFREPLEQGWLYDPEEPPAAQDLVGPRWRDFFSAATRAARAEPSRASTRNSVASNIEQQQPLKNF